MLWVVREAHILYTVLAAVGQRRLAWDGVWVSCLGCFGRNAADPNAFPTPLPVRALCTQTVNEPSQC
jgi:hypothetical protein